MSKSITLQGSVNIHLVKFIIGKGSFLVCLFDRYSKKKYQSNIIAATSKWIVGSFLLATLFWLTTLNLLATLNGSCIRVGNPEFDITLLSNFFEWSSICVSNPEFTLNDINVGNSEIDMNLYEFWHHWFWYKLCY